MGTEKWWRDWAGRSTYRGDWADDVTADFSALMQRTLADMRQAVGRTRGTES